MTLTSEQNPRVLGYMTSLCQRLKLCIFKIPLGVRELRPNPYLTFELGVGLLNS